MIENHQLKSDIQTIELGREMALKCQNHFNRHDDTIMIHLKGELGAGKTTFSRGFLQALGHQGNVKSPTYTLVEPYEFDHFSVYHFDLYRLTDPEELEFMGIRDYLQRRCICLIEWPERAQCMLSQADIEIELLYSHLERQVIIRSMTEKGINIMLSL